MSRAASSAGIRKVPVHASPCQSEMTKWNLLGGLRPPFGELLRAHRGTTRDRYTSSPPPARGNYPIAKAKSPRALRRVAGANRRLA
jgi:hypothetical protein